MANQWNNKSQSIGWDTSSAAALSGYPPYPAQIAPTTYPAQIEQTTYPAQPGYPVYPTPSYTMQPNYPLQPGYVTHAQPGAPMPSGYISTMPPPYSISGSAAQAVPTVSIHDPVHTNSQNDAEAPKTENIPQNFGASFSTRAIRHSFIRKVYAIVTLQLVVTLAFVAVFTLHEDVKKFVQRNRWVYILSYIVFLVTYFTLICCSGVRRKWPGNLIMLSIFTLSMAYILGTISAFYETDVVLLAIGITALVCFLITLFAVQTKIDFTGCGTYLFIASVVIFIFGIMAIFMRNNIMHLVYSGGITLLFSMYLIFDTQRIVGGKKHELSAEEHIYGALVLYIDVVMIFLGILGLSRYS